MTARSNRYCRNVTLTLVTRTQLAVGCFLVRLLMLKRVQAPDGSIVRRSTIGGASDGRGAVRSGPVGALLRMGRIGFYGAMEPPQPTSSLEYRRHGPSPLLRAIGI